MDKWDPSAVWGCGNRRRKLRWKGKDEVLGELLREGTQELALPAGSSTRPFSTFHHSQPPPGPSADANTHAGEVIYTVCSLKTISPKFKRGFPAPRVLPLAKGPSVRKQRAVGLQIASQAESKEPACCPATGATQAGTGSALLDSEGKILCLLPAARQFGLESQRQGKNPYFIPEHIFGVQSNPHPWA